MKTKPTRHWIINRDIKGAWEMPKETCGGCVHGLKCQTCGYPSSKDDTAYSIRWENGIHSHIRFEEYVNSFLVLCERPLGMARLGNVKPICKHQSLWLSKYVPLRAKSELLVEIADEAMTIMTKIVEVEKAGGLTTPRFPEIQKSVKLIHKLAELFDRQQICLKTNQSTDHMMDTLASDYRNSASSVSASNPVPIISTALTAFYSLSRLVTHAAFAGGTGDIKQKEYYNAFIHNAYWAANKLAEIQGHMSVEFEIDEKYEYATKMTEKEWGMFHTKYSNGLEKQVNRLIELAK